MVRGTETITKHDGRMGVRAETVRSTVGATAGDRGDHATRAQTWAAVGALCATALVLLLVLAGG